MKLREMMVCGTFAVLGAAQAAAQSEPPRPGVKPGQPDRGELLRNASAPAPRNPSAVRRGRSEWIAQADGPETDLRKLEKELADLNAATDRRRAELMRKLAELRARQADAQKKKALENLTARNKLDGWKNLDIGEHAAPQPVWMIGVSVEQDEAGEGVKVKSVVPDKPAEKAGIKAGDQIVACNGIRLRDNDALVHVIQAARDQELTLTVKRVAARGDGEGEGENAEAVAEEIEVRVTPEKSAGPLAEIPLLGDIPHIGRLFPGHDHGGLTPNAAIPREQYGLLVDPQRATIDQLAKDSAEIKELLKRLLEEAKEGRTD